MLKKPLIVYHTSNNEISQKAINQKIDFVLENDSLDEIVISGTLKIILLIFTINL